MIFVWFTFPRDYAKLAHSVVSVRNLAPEAKCVLVISSGDPAPEIEEVEVMVRDFDRGIHLNGVAATIGVAEVLSSIESDVIVKIDSDMRVLHPFWLDGPVVFQRENSSFVGLYALPLAVTSILPCAIQDTPSVLLHEGMAMGWVARNHGVRVEQCSRIPSCIQFISKL